MVEERESVGCRREREWGVGERVWAVGERERVGCRRESGV